MAEDKKHPVQNIDFKKVLANIDFTPKTIQEEFEGIKTIHHGKLEALETLAKVIYKSTNTEAGKKFLQGKLSAKDYKELKDKEDIDSFCEALSMSMGEYIGKDFTAQMVFIYSFTMFDAFWEQVFEYLLRLDPTPLTKTDKKYTVEHVLSFESQKEFVAHLVEEQVHKFGYLSFQKKVDFLHKYYKFHVHDEIAPVHQNLHKNWELRNLFVHKSGFPTKEFVKEFPEFGVNEKVQAKSSLILYNFKYMKDYIDYTCDYFSRLTF